MQLFHLVVDGGWGDWSAFSHCSESCGGGNQARARVCDSPSPAGGGATCSGVSEETQACNTQECFGSYLDNRLFNERRFFLNFTRLDSYSIFQRTY